jgi:hypothetical protein
MARSLTVNHQETPSTNPLLTGFLLLCIAWLALGTIAGAAFAPEAPPVTTLEVR